MKKLLTIAAFAAAVVTMTSAARADQVCYRTSDGRTVCYETGNSTYNPWGYNGRHSGWGNYGN